MRYKYLHQYDSFQYKKRKADSNVWQNVMNCRELIQQGMISLVGDGKNILFRFDNWIENHNLCDLLDLERGAIPNPDSRVSDFLQNRNWDLGKLLQFINNQAIIYKIIGIMLPFTAMKDTFC